jgi:hypothetical protein
MVGWAPKAISLPTTHHGLLISFGANSRQGRCDKQIGFWTEEEERGPPGPERELMVVPAACHYFNPSRSGGPTTS